ncbi:MAG: hypothetical protein DME97_07525 [Verrucomicrobia bacterium]|nr:MAG: hypothetical protein DME97_07525 [Verrucomicrobiota bacterium]
MTRKEVIEEMQCLRPFSDTAPVDPMLWMYFLKMIDSFSEEVTTPPTIEELNETARKLREWLIRRIESVNDLNIKANYEQSLAYVEWFRFEHNCSVALSPSDDDSLHAAKAALARSKDYAKQYENRMGDEAFIYSELQEKLVHARTFVEEVEQMNKSLDKLIEAIKAAENLTKVMNDLNAGVTAVTKAAKDLTDAAAKLQSVAPPAPRSGT